MKRFYQFLNVVILISFISCQQFEINDLTIKKLDNQEINQFAITKELVKKKSKEQYDILYSKENIEYKRKMKFPEKKYLDSLISKIILKKISINYLFSNLKKNSLIY